MLGFKGGTDEPVWEKKQAGLHSKYAYHNGEHVMVGDVPPHASYWPVFSEDIVESQRTYFLESIKCK
ncbi:MAG: hypothetical protein ACXVCN_10060 [Bdellovibrio sp.]